LRQLLYEWLTELKFLWVVDFVELDYKITVQIEKDVHAFDQFFDYFESSLGFNDGGLAEGLFEVIYDLYISFLGLLYVLVKVRLLHFVTADQLL